MKGMKTQHLVPTVSFLLTAACGPSLATMHDAATAGRVQEGAPLHTRETVTIAAPRERVYALLTDFGGWPRWQPNITKVTPPKAVEPGARFEWSTAAR